MNEPINVPKTLTIRETAELFKLPVHFVRQSISNGSVVSVRAGRKFLVNAESVMTFLSTGKPQGAAANITESSRHSKEENAPRITPISLR